VSGLLYSMRSHIEVFGRGGLLARSAIHDHARDFDTSLRRGLLKPCIRLECQRKWTFFPSLVLIRMGAWMPLLIQHQSGGVTKIVLQPDGKIITSGSTFMFGNGLARLNPDGSLDTNFNPAATSSWSIQPDGKILAGSSSPNRPVQDGIVRLNPDGSLDLTFDPGLAGTDLTSVRSLQDGKLLVGGSFTTSNSIPRNGVVRLFGSDPENAPRLLFPESRAEGFQMFLVTSRGQKYFLESKNILTQPDWQPVLDSVGDGAVNRLTDTNSAVSLRFYRIRMK